MAGAEAELALAGRRAVVTGASRGIGRAIAERLAAGGARVLLIARGRAALEEAARAVGGIAVVADVSDAMLVAGLPESAKRAMSGTADLLVNAAGAFALASVADTPIDAFDEQIAVNLRGPFLMIRAFLPGMLAAGSGDIVTLGSIAGRIAFPMNAAYSASKFGVRGLHAVLDQELRGTGVRSTLVEPAATDTPLWDPIDRGRHPELPPRGAMLGAGAVADAVVWAVTRPADAAVRTIAMERA
ncbi:MAG: SDR family oxidoreductase [Longimicrobiales bacterium]